MLLTNNHKIYLIVILAFSVLNCSSQDLPTLNKNFLFQRTHISFSFTPTYCFKGKTKLSIGNQDLSPQNLLGGEAGFNLIFHLSEKWGIKTGLQGGASPLDFGYKIVSPYDSVFNYSIPDNIATAAYGFDGNFYGYVNAPLQLEYRQKISRSTLLLVSSGIALKWTIAPSSVYQYTVSTTDSTNNTFLKISTEQAHNRVTFPLGFSAGFGFVLKNKNMILLNMKSEIGLNNLIVGKFVFFPNTNYTSAGTYSKNGSYVGLEIGYRLTKGNKMQSLVSPEAYEYIQNKGHINSTDSLSFDKIFSKGQIGVNIGSRFNLSPYVTPTKGDKPTISGLPYPQISLDYTFNKNKKWGIKTGFAYSIYQYKYKNINYQSSSSLPSFTNDIYFGQDIFTWDINFEYRCHLKKSWLLYGDLGFVAGLFSDRGVTYAAAVDYWLINAQNLVTGQVNEKVLTGSNIGAGIMYAAKNYNLWRIGVNWFNSFTTAAAEQYSFNNGFANQQTGTTKITGSSITLSAGYVYSFAPSPYAIATRKLKIQSAEKLPKQYITPAHQNAIYTKNQIEAAFQLNYMMRPKVTTHGGENSVVGTYGTLGLKAGYMFNINKHWSVIPGLGIGKYDYYVDIVSSYNKTDSIGYIYSVENGITRSAIDLLLEYRFSIGRSSLWYTDFGLSASGNFSNGDNYLSKTENDSTSLTITYIDDNSFKSGAIIGTGILFTFRNYNQLRIGVQYYQPFNELLSHEYDIRRTSGESLATGSIEAGGSLVSINIGYVFSFKRPEKY